MTYRPRNRNERTQEAPKSTARWFDDRGVVPAGLAGAIVSDVEAARVTP